MDKEADKIKARRLPRFEALIPDELARCVDVEYAGSSGLVTMRRCFEKGLRLSPTGAEIEYPEIVTDKPFGAGPSGGLLPGEFCDRQIQPNTVKSVFRLDAIALNGGTEALG